MKIKIRAVLLPVILLLVASLQYSCNQKPVLAISNRIENIIDSLNRTGITMVCNDLICAPSALPRFYQLTGYSPLWIEPDGLTQRGEQLMVIIENSESDGFSPEDYHIKKIRENLKLINQKINFDELEIVLAETDILCTDGYLLLASNMYLGKVNPVTAAPEWKAQRKESNLRFDDYLYDAFIHDKIENSIASLAPKNSSYINMKNAFNRLKAIKIENNKYPIIPIESYNKTHKFIAYSQLQILNYIKPVKKYNSFILEKALTAYKSDHGLENEVGLSQKTIESLNTPIISRINTLLVNMERYRWLPNKNDHEFITVNIADFELSYFKNDSLKLKSKAIVGKEYRKTPVFSDSIQYLVFNPYWTMPKSIFTKDILPRLKKDTTYIKNKGIEILDYKLNSIHDSLFTNWDNDSIFNYIYRQIPGPHNPLGRVKFMFPNKYHVYIHDTPQKTLFNKDQRLFSSGCIRIEKPIELAAALLDSSTFTKDSILYFIDTAQILQPITVPLERSIPVHILYFTAWGAKNKNVQFRNDIYNRDDQILKAINKRLPKLLVQ